MRLAWPSNKHVRCLNPFLVYVMVVLNPVQGNVRKNESQLRNHIKKASFYGAQEGT